MYEYLAALPAEGWFGLLALLGGALWKPAELIARWLRSSSDAGIAASAKRAEIESDRDASLIGQLLDQARNHDEMQIALRKALDKGLVRENALVTAAELLLGIAELIDDPSAAQKLMRLRAIEILEMAKHMRGST